MASGIMITQADLDNMVGGIAREVNRLMIESIPLVRSKLNALTQSGMVALPQGGRSSAMTTGEASDLMNAMNELYDLSQVYLGSKVVASGGAITDGSGHDFTLYTQIVYGFGF